MGSSGKMFDIKAVRPCPAENSEFKQRTFCLFVSLGLTSLSMDGVAKEGHPKFIPRPGRGMNPGSPEWRSEILPLALALLTAFNDDQ